MNDKVKVNFIWNRGKVFCRVTMPNQSIASFYTGVRIERKYFQNGAIISNCPEHEKLTDKLVETFYEVRSQKPHNNESGSTFVDRLRGREGTHHNMVPKTILEAMRYTIDRKDSVTKSRMSAYRNAYKYLYEYLTEASEYGDMKLRELDQIVFNEWVVWLRELKGLSLKTSEVYMSTIHGTMDYVAKRFVKYEEVPGYNPISGAGSLSAKEKKKLRKKTLRNHLSEEEIKKIEGCNRGEWSAKDFELWYYVLWQLYTGASFADAFYGEYTIITTVDDEEFLQFYRVKTEEECYVPLSQHIKNLIAYFRNESLWADSCGYWTRINKGNELAEHQAYRRFITKRIQPLIGRHITSHTFRHTFGMRMINEKGYTADQVQRMMGHTSIKTTMDNYARLNLPTAK